MHPSSTLHYISPQLWADAALGLDDAFGLDLHWALDRQSGLSAPALGLGPEFRRCRSLQTQCSPLLLDLILLSPTAMAALDSLKAFSRADAMLPVGCLLGAHSVTLHCL